MFAEPWKFDKIEQTVGCILTKFVEKNADRMSHKFDNLEAKMKGLTAMTQFSLPIRETYPDFVALLAPAELEKNLDDMMKKPWLWATVPHSWQWDFNTYPLPGTANIFHCQQGRITMVALNLGELLTDDLSGVAALHSYLSGNPFDSAEKKSSLFVATILEGEGVVVPFGFLPVVFGHTKEEDEVITHCRAIIYPVCTDKCTDKCTASEKASIKAYIDQEIVKHADVKCWSEIKAPLLQWCGTW